MSLESLKAKVRVVPSTESTRSSKAAKELLEIQKKRSSQYSARKDSAVAEFVDRLNHA